MLYYSVNNWIDRKLGDIAKKLPSLVHTEPASFACGYNAGYKGALLDLHRYLDDLGLLEEQDEQL